MRRPITLLVALLLVPLAAYAQSPTSVDAPPPKPNQAAESVPTLGKLLFSGKQDVADVWGQLSFGVTPVRLIRECEPLDFKIVAFFPLPDGVWEVFGQQVTETSRGGEAYDRIMSWRLIRATSRDGVNYENRQTVFEAKPAAWSDHHAMAYNPDAKEYLLLKLKVDRSGFGYSAFFSPDGQQWREHPENPLFYDGDAMSLFWSPVLRRFVCVSKSLQPHRKRIWDHGGPTPSLNDESLRDRRVLMLRTSLDGRKWEPSVSMPDVWNRHGKKGSIPAEFLTMPDADDPPDLEFYSGNAFWYHDRAYMMVLNYAASPTLPRKHGKQLDNEWWTSSDGLRWERPARGMNVLEMFPRIDRLECNPLVANGMVLFPHGTFLQGVEEDRISYVTSRSNAEFSTKPFTMPQAELLLNAAVPSPVRPFAKDRSHVMVSVLDAQGNVIPGFEPEKCVMAAADRSDIPLKWDGTSARQLAGQIVRLRFSLRSANIYAVTTR